MTAPVSKSYKSLNRWTLANPTYGHPDDGNDASTTPFQGVDLIYRNNANGTDKPYRGPVSQNPRDMQEAVENDEDGTLDLDARTRVVGEPDGVGGNPGGEPSDEAKDTVGNTATKTATPTTRLDREEAVRETGEADGKDPKELDEAQEKVAERHNSSDKTGKQREGQAKSTRAAKDNDE